MLLASLVYYNTLGQNELFVGDRQAYRVGIWLPREWSYVCKRHGVNDNTSGLWASISCHSRERGSVYITIMALGIIDYLNTFCLPCGSWHICHTMLAWNLPRSGDLEACWHGWVTLCAVMMIHMWALDLMLLPLVIRL